MSFIKSAVLSTARAAGAFAWARSRTADTLRILAYHGVDGSSSRLENFDGLHVPPDVFAAQLDHLRKHYEVISMGEGLARLSEPGGDPRGAVVITFDDGYKNNAAQAAPLLKSFGMTASFFVTTGFIDGTCGPWWVRFRKSIERMNQPDVTLMGRKWKTTQLPAMEFELKNLPAAERERELAELGNVAPPEMMTWDDVRKLVADGFEVGPHTVTHVSLGVEPDEVVLAEIKESTRRLQAETGRISSVYSYPYGRAQDRPRPEVESCLEQLGYRGGLTTTEGFCRRGDALFSLKRINVSGDHAGAAFESLVSGATDFIRGAR